MYKAFQIIFSMLLFAKLCNCEYGIMQAHSVLTFDSLQSLNVCISYNTKYTKLPSFFKEPFALHDLTPNTGCHENNLPNIDLSGKFPLMLAIQRGNCWLTYKLASIQKKYNITNILIVSDTPLDTPLLWDNQYAEKYNRTIVPHKGGINFYMITSNDFSQIKAKFNATSKPDLVNKTLALVSYKMIPPTYDFGPFVLIAIALIVVNLGAFLGAKSYFKKCKLLEESLNEIARPREGSNLPATADNSKAIREVKESHHAQAFSITSVIIMVVFMCLFLTMVWYFYKYAVYYLIYVFCLYATIAVYSFLKYLLNKIPLPDINLVPGFSKREVAQSASGYARAPPDPATPLNSVKRSALFSCRSCLERSVKAFLREITVKNVIALTLALSISLYWLVHRHESHAWILQDVLGASLCLYILNTLHLTNLKVGLLLLSLLFFFDIFFVFLTPYLTKSHTSIMLDIVTGGESTDHLSLKSLFQVSGLDTSPPYNVSPAPEEKKVTNRQEQIPLAFKVPHISFRKQSADPCEEQSQSSTHYSYIGYGDIVMPGLFLAFCFFYDKIKIKRRPSLLYTFVSSLGYILGLGATYLALYLMKRGQPALLYLVPFTLGPVMIIAWIRKEFYNMWTGGEPAPSNNVNNVTTLNSASPTVVTSQIS